MSRIDVERFIPNTILMALCFTGAIEILRGILHGRINPAQLSVLEASTMGIGFFTLVAYGFFCLAEMWRSLPDEQDEIQESINITGF